MRKVFALLSMLLVLALVVGACAAPPPTAAPAAEAPAAEEPAAEEPAAEAPAAAGEGVIRIATQTPLSGPQSSLGTAIKNGAQLALETHGATIGDFTVELAPFDDQATPDIGVANAKQIVADPSVLCLVGHLNSGVMIPSSEEYHSAGLAAVSPANTNPVVTDRGYPEINRIVGRDDVQGVVGAEFAFNELGVKSVYVIHDQTAYGQGVAEFFRQHSEELGMEVLGFEGTEEQSNFDSILTPIVAANPDLVYFGGIYSQAGIFLRQMREKGLESQFLGPDGFDSSELVALGGDAAIDVHFTTTSVPASAFPRAGEFAAAYEERFQEQFQSYAAYGADSMNICLAAIERAVEAAGGMPTRAQVATEVRATADFDGITGTITFNEIGDLTVAKYVVLRVTSGNVDDWANNEVVSLLEIAAPGAAQ